MSDSKQFSIWGKGGFGIFSHINNDEIKGIRIVQNATTNLSFKEISKTNTTINNIERKKIFGYIINVQTEVMVTRKGFYYWQNNYVPFTNTINMNNNNMTSLLGCASHFMWTPIYAERVGIFPFFDPDYSFSEQFYLDISKNFVVDIEKTNIKQIDKQLEVGQIIKMTYHNTIPYTKNEFGDLIKQYRFDIPPQPTGTNNNYYNN